MTISRAARKHIAFNACISLLDVVANNGNKLLLQHSQRLIQMCRQGIESVGTREVSPELAQEIMDGIAELLQDN